MSKRGWISVATLALVSVVAFGVLSAFGARSQPEGVSVVSLEPASVVVGPMGPFEAPDLANEPKRTATGWTQTAFTVGASLGPMDLYGTDWTVPVRAKNAEHGKIACPFGEF